MNQMKCDNCGATLQISQEKPIAFCPYCGFAVKQPETSTEFAKYAMEHEEKVRQRKVQEEYTAKHKEARAWVIGLIIFVLGMTAAIYFGVARPHNQRVQALESLSIEIQQDILNEKYDDALIKATQLRLDDDVSGDENRRWNRIREDYINQIKTLKKEKRQ